MSSAIFRVVIACYCVLAVCSLVGPLKAEEVSSLTERARVVAQPLIESGTASGVAVGLLVAGDDNSPERITFGLGYADDDQARPCTAETLFEIGSVTKTFTGLLLADMVLRGEVALDDPVQKYLPDEVRMPVRNDQPICLVHLANHSSGLPRMPNNFKPADDSNPYADYDAARLYEFLSGYRLRFAPEQRTAYSNVAMGLLGHLLERAADTPYETLVRQRICQPLGMPDTVQTLDENHRAQFATGHDADGNATSAWDFDVVAPAGALRSNVNDMLTYLEAQLCLDESPLTAAIRLSQQPTGAKNGVSSVALGWHLSDGGKLIAHDGGTGGYRSFVGFRPDEKTGVVVLCNTAVDVNRLGRALLDAAAGREANPPQYQVSIDLSEDQLEQLVGDYELEGAGVMEIRREGDSLFAKLDIQPRFRIWPTDENKFFYRVVNAQITFERDDSGAVSGLVLHQNGRDMKAPRFVASN